MATWLNVVKHTETSWNIVKHLQSCRSHCKLGGQINNPVGKGMCSNFTIPKISSELLHLLPTKHNSIENFQQKPESDNRIWHAQWTSTSQLAGNPAGNSSKKWTTLPGKYLRDFMFSVSMLKIHRCIQLSNPRTVNFTAINPGADVVDLLFVVLNQESHSQPVKHSKCWAWQYFKLQVDLLRKYL